MQKARLQWPGFLLCELCDRAGVAAPIRQRRVAQLEQDAALSPVVPTPARLWCWA
jgi:hypothetical protein